MNPAIVCGGRDFTNAKLLDHVLSSRLPSLVITGGCPRGADALAEKWCDRHGIPYLVMRALWSAEGKRAGPIRNGRMLLLMLANELIAFPGGRGTADMVRQATRECLKVTIVPAAAREGAGDE